MKTKFTTCALVALMFVFVAAANSLADDSRINIPITADQAFDAVAKQLDPATGKPASVALIDVRTTAEYYWVGACAKVESIVTTSGREFIPHLGKVKFWKGRNILKFKVLKRKRLRPVYLPIKKVDEIVTTDISIHIPTHVWIDDDCEKVENSDFEKQINALGQDNESGLNYDVIILMCRSGKRSDTRGFNTDLFDAIYEIDQPDGTTGRGGFQGTSYGDVYNGYRGFPGRKTNRQESPSVSWSDAGLPVHIGWTPYSPEFPTDSTEPTEPSEPTDPGIPY